MTHILVIWAVVGFAGTQFNTHAKMGWVPIGDFRSEKSCVEGARQLGAEAYRCLPK